MREGLKFAGCAFLAGALSACGSSKSPAQASGGASSTGGSGNTPVLAVSVTVSGTAPTAVSPNFFGENFWSWVNAYGNPVALVQDQVSELGLGFLRAGGANNDTQTPEAFSQQKIDEFVAYARAVGAEPSLQVPAINGMSGAPATADDAAAMVSYANVTQAYGIRYFEIGNEPDLYTSQNLRDASYDAAALCTSFTQFAQAMRAVDPTIQIIGPDLSWKYQSGANDWLTPFLQNCGDQIDIVAVHRYPIDPAACSEAAAYADGASFRQTIEHVRSIMQATGQAAKPLAVTEANITWDGTPEKSILPASPGTFPAGLWVADSLGVALEEGLFSMDYWSLSEGWTLGFLDGTTPRPAFQVLKMFSKGFGDQVLSVNGAPSGVSVYAGRDTQAMRTNVFVVNKSAQALQLSITLQGLPRTDSPTLAVPALSLYSAALPDDGSAPVLTSYTSSMSAPTQVSE